MASLIKPLTVVVLSLLFSRVLCFAPGAQVWTKALQVWDDVLQDGAQLRLLDSSLKQRGGGAHAVLDRRHPWNGGGTLCERVIDALLQSLGDSSRYVEYWYRDEWISLEVHQDVDEHLAREAGEQRRVRFPESAHVLYLQCGPDVAGPTCIYINSSGATGGSGDMPFDTLALVPAKANRLLRFQGDLFHSVPRPALAYLDPCEGGSNLELHVRTGPPESGASDRRAVLLFNTWGEPPLNVPVVRGPAGAETTPAGEVAVDLQSQASVERRDRGGDRLVALKAPLLGDAVRRGGARRIRGWLSELARDGLLERTEPSVYSLYGDKAAG